MKAPSKDGEVAAVCGSSPPAGSAFESAPLVWAYLADTRYDDGTIKQQASLTVFVEGHMCKLCLSDKDRSCVAFRAGTTFEEALEAMEKGIAGGTLDWRGSKPLRR